MIEAISLLKRAYYLLSQNLFIPIALGLLIVFLLYFGRNHIKRLHIFLSQNLFYPIALGTLLVFIFYFGRVIISQDFLFKNLIWNLFLAWLPYCFSLGIAALHRLKPDWWYALIIPGGFWLVFLPNSFYIVTDLIHVSQRHSIPVWYDAGLIAITAWTGIFLAVASLHSVQGVVRNYLGNIMGWVFSLIVIGLSGYGVYLGRFLRWNSWDLLLEPTEILSDTLSPLLHPITYADKIGFIVMYTSLYLVTYLTFSWLRPFVPLPQNEELSPNIAGD